MAAGRSHDQRMTPPTAPDELASSSKTKVADGIRFLLRDECRVPRQLSYLSTCLIDACESRRKFRYIVWHPRIRKKIKNGCIHIYYHATENQ